MLALASRPLKRSSIIAGKFFTYSLVTALYSALMVTIISLLSWHFFHLIIDIKAFFIGILLFMLFPVIILAITYLGSATMSTLTAGVGSFIFFAISLFGGFIEQIGALMNNTSLINMGIISSLIMPSDSIYRLAVATAGGDMGHNAIINFGPFGVTSTPSFGMLGYALIYIVVLVVLAAKYFEKRDL